MEPSRRVQRRRSEDLGKLPQGHRHQDRNYDCEQNHERDSERQQDKGGMDDSTRSKQRRRSKSKRKREEGFVKKYGALLFAGSLGFGAGFLFATIRQNNRVKHTKRTNSDDSHGYTGHHEELSRLDDGRLNGRLAIMGPTARGHSVSRSTSHFPRDDDTDYGYWR